MKKIWEYECTVDGIAAERKYQFANGGSVQELPDNSLFVNMSHEAYTKIFIVDRDKNVLWSAIPEGWDKVKQKWTPIFQYRASMITDKNELGQMIWGH